MPHISEILVDNLQKMIDDVEVVTLVNKEKKLEAVCFSESKIIVDLVRIPQFELHENYKGLGW